MAAALGVVAAAFGAAALVTQDPLAKDTGAGHGAAAGQPKASPTLTVTNSGSMAKDHHTLRVVSAPTDLSGQRELAWAADSGHPVGAARCTQNFRIGASAAPRVRPTMLLCWRTSPDRSVYTIAVDVDHPPSERASVTTINEVWSKLG
jgi:hypothetical protein